LRYENMSNFFLCPQITHHEKIALLLLFLIILLINVWRNYAQPHSNTERHLMLF
jgi:hypothetical protein